MNIRSIARIAERILSDNSPAILTGVGISGTIVTSVLAARGAVRADRILRDAEEDMTKREVFDATWREFAPAAVVGTATVSAIFMANHIGSRRAAAAVAAFRISEELSRDYKSKVTEIFGKKAEEDVRAKVAKDRMDRTPGSETIIITGSDVVVFDEWSGRYFRSSPADIERAVNQLNQKVNNNFCASLQEFYDLLGLDPTVNSDDFGWNTDELLDVSFTAVVMSDGRPALSMHYSPKPISKYDRVM